MHSYTLNAAYLIAFGLMMGLCTFLGKYLSMLSDFGPPTFWPAAGVYFAFILFSKTKDWWKLVLVGFIAVGIADILTRRYNFPISAIAWLGKSAMMLMGAWIIKYLFARRTSDYRGWLAFIIIGGILTPAVAAIFSSQVRPLQPFEPSRFYVWRFHFAGSSLGVLTITPFLFLFMQWLESKTTQYRTKDVAINCLLLIALCVFTDLVFRDLAPPNPLKSPFILFALLVAVAFRGDLMLTASANLCVSLLIVWHTLNDRGVALIFPSRLDAMTAIQILILTFVLTGSLLTSSICERRRGVADLAEKKKQLERANADLAEAKEAAIAASHAKTGFIADLSHEIRSPLGAMIGFADLISDEKTKNVDRISYAEIIKKNGMHLGELINQILDISKIEAGKLDIEVQATDVRPLIEDAIQLMQLKASEKGLTLKVDISPRTPARILTDAFRLRQILLNALSNAIKFTEHGTISLNVDAEIKGKQWRLICDVHDTGIGLGDDEAARLFKTFSQASATTSKRYGGSGLGLILSRRLAQLLGGDYQLLYSQRGEGSCFRFYVDGGPLNAYVSSHYGVSQMQGATKGLNKPLDGFKVLLADDAEDNRLLIGRYLQIAGAHVVEANNGKEALDYVATEHFDIVLLDVQMPVMDGLEAVKRLRERSYHDPVIALTGRAMQSEIEECLKSGFDAHFIKPIDREFFIQKLSTYAHQPNPSVHKEIAPQSFM